MNKISLKSQISNWLASNPLQPALKMLPPDEQPDKRYFSVIAGVRFDFQVLKIHLARYPEIFRNMNYALSKEFSLQGFFPEKSQRRDKIIALSTLLKEVALDLAVPPDSIHIPFMLIVEDESGKDAKYDDEIFYDTTSYPCGIAGSGERDFELVVHGIHVESLRYDFVCIGDKNIIAVSVDDSDEGALAAAGILDDYTAAAFGRVTFMQNKNDLNYALTNKHLSIESGNNSIAAWSGGDLSLFS